MPRKPNSASSAVQAGSPADTLRRVRVPSAANPAVSTCGYISSASAEPRARVAYAGCCPGVSTRGEWAGSVPPRARAAPSNTAPGPPNRSRTSQQTAVSDTNTATAFSAAITVGARSPCR